MLALSFPVAFSFVICDIPLDSLCFSTSPFAHQCLQNPSSNRITRMDIKNSSIESIERELFTCYLFFSMNERFSYLDVLADFNMHAYPAVVRSSHVTLSFFLHSTFLIKLLASIHIYIYICVWTNTSGSSQAQNYLYAQHFFFLLVISVDTVFTGDVQRRLTATPSHSAF